MVAWCGDLNGGLDRSYQREDVWEVWRYCDNILVLVVVKTEEIDGIQN